METNATLSSPSTWSRVACTPYLTSDYHGTADVFLCKDAALIEDVSQAENVLSSQLNFDNVFQSSAGLMMYAVSQDS